MVNQLRKAMLVVVAIAALLAACAPAQAPTQDQGQVATAVAATVQAQAGSVAASVLSTLTAQAPAATATESPTPIALDLPATNTPFPTSTAFVVTSGGSGGSTGGSSAPLYSCSVREVQPRTNVFHPGDTSIQVTWVITNTGTKDWQAGKDLHYVNGPMLSNYTGQELPALKTGDSVTIHFVAAAPLKKGLYGMQFKVEGGLCWPALNLQVVPAPDP
jgi:hypothetical protein